MDRWKKLCVLIVIIMESSIMSYSFESRNVCSNSDSCNVLSFFRTCTCDHDCYRYGTCCQDAPAFDDMNHNKETFECYDDRVPQAIYAKRTCASDFDGGEVIRDSCLKTNRNMSDLMVTVLVSSNKTWTTYWNYNCAVCNGENDTDLTFWTIQASCPLQRGNRRFYLDDIRKSLIYDTGSDTWGVKDHGAFMRCSLDFWQPPTHMEHLRYCTQGLVSTCRKDWKDVSVRRKCQSYYDERRSKTSKTYYKNVHCAACNKVPLSDLECVGRNQMAKFSKGNFTLIRVVYNLNSWMGEHNRGQPKCAAGHRYDPFLKKCRNVKCGLVHPDMEEEFCPEMVLNAAVSLLPSWIYTLVVTASYMRYVNQCS